MPGTQEEHYLAGCKGAVSNLCVYILGAQQAAKQCGGCEAELSCPDLPCCCEFCCLVCRTKEESGVLAPSFLAVAAKCPEERYLGRQEFILAFRCRLQSAIAAEAAVSWSHDIHHQRAKNTCRLLLSFLTPPSCSSGLPVQGMVPLTVGGCFHLS